MPRPHPLAGASMALLAACITTPTAAIPQPLPETLAWAASTTEGSGAYLGLKTRENIAGGFDALDFPPGLYVTRVVENSPAAVAGCRVGDVLLSFDERATDDPDTLEALVAGGTPGESATLEVQRGDTVFEVPVVLGEPLGGAAVEARVKARLDPARSRAAWCTGRGGVVLVAAHEEAPFPRAGIPVGSVVHALDGESVHSDAALIRALQARDPGTTVEISWSDAEGDVRTTDVELQDVPTKVTRVSLPVLFTYDSDIGGEDTTFVLLDLWIVSLFRYERHGGEELWRFLRFIEFRSGVGELTE